MPKIVPVEINQRRLSMWEKLDELLVQVVVVGCAVAYVVAFVVLLVGNVLSNFF